MKESSSSDSTSSSLESSFYNDDKTLKLICVMTFLITGNYFQSTGAHLVYTNCYSCMRCRLCKIPIACIFDKLVITSMTSLSPKPGISIISGFRIHSSAISVRLWKVRAHSSIPNKVPNNYKVNKGTYVFFVRVLQGKVDEKVIKYENYFRKVGSSRTLHIPEVCLAF